MKKGEVVASAQLFCVREPLTFWLLVVIVAIVAAALWGPQEGKGDAHRAQHNPIRARPRRESLSPNLDASPISYQKPARHLADFLCLLREFIRNSLPGALMSRGRGEAQ